ncbi:MAG: hypothetical protein ACRD5L_17420 [Bryobacteraceae bacterium]
MNPPPPTVEPALILQAHNLYCQLTAQRLTLGFDRERMWYELLRAGVTLPQIRQLIRYLQREIREGRRNVGALKLSNLLQPDRFEEDLAISRVALQPPRPTGPAPQLSSALNPQDQEQGRQRALEHLRQLKVTLK